MKVGLSGKRWRTLLACLGLALLGCGARTPLDGQSSEGDAPDAGPSDVGTTDARILDSGDTSDADLPDSGEIGGACLRRSDCDGLVCGLNQSADRVDLDPVPLICQRPIGKGRVLADCETGADCESGLCLFVGTCAEPCQVDSDCSELPPETSPRCAETFVVTSDTTMQLISTCGQGISLGDGVIQDRSSVADLGFDGAVTLEGPGGLYLLDHRTAFETFFYQLASESGSLCDFSTLSPDGPRQINPFSPGAAFTSVFVPSGSTELADRRYFLTYSSAESGGTVSISHFSRASGSPRVLHINVVRVGAGRGDIEPELRETVESLTAAFVGLRVVIDHYSTFVGGLARRYSLLSLGDDEGRDSELVPLFELTHGARDAALNLFFVREIDGALGVAGGIPGAQVMHGTPGSGVVIARDQSLMSRADLLSVTAHETGHFLGLFHTTELDGSQLEALDDTPECPADFDENGDGFVDPAECAANGSDNLMFWSGDGFLFSAEQLQSAQRALVLRED